MLPVNQVENSWGCLLAVTLLFDGCEDPLDLHLTPCTLKKLIETGHFQSGSACYWFL